MWKWFKYITIHRSSPATIQFYIYYSVQSQHRVCHCSLLLHQDIFSLTFWTVYNWPIVLLCVYVEDHRKKMKKRSHIVDKLTEQTEWWQEAQTHIICDFLSKVGLCDEDLRDFLTGSIKHTSHQWVFIVPQSCSLLKVTDRENNWPHTHTHTQIKTQDFSWNSHNESYDSPPDSCTI